jgi:hypothetical protein
MKSPLLCCAMNYSQIKLHKNHIPLNPYLCIKNQVDYDYYINTLLYLHNQLELGFNPKWMVSFHYQHPVEHGKSIKETNKTLGFGDRYGFKTYRNLWNEVPMYNYWDKQRNTEERVIEDASQIKNAILKYLYGIKRLNRTDRNEYPNLFFFHEKGKTKLQYHTHLLLPSKNLKIDEYSELEDVFNTTIRKSRKCFSKWKKIHIAPVQTKYDVIGYLNKETNSNHISFDPYNSNPIIPQNTQK